MKYFILAQKILDKRHDLRIEVAKHNLEFPILFLMFLAPSLYSEIYDYSYYKCFTRFWPSVSLVVWTYRKVEHDENHYTFLALLGQCSAAMAEGFWMFREEVCFLVGTILFLIFTFFQGVSSIVNICSERPFEKIKLSAYRNLIMISLVIFLYGWAMSEINSFGTILPFIVRPYWYGQSWMMITQIWRYNKTCLRSYAYGVIGSIIYIVGDLLFSYRRLYGDYNDWVINMTWLSLHSFGQFFMMQAVVLHLDIYFERNKKIKQEKARADALKWWEKEKLKMTKDQEKKINEWKAQQVTVGQQIEKAKAEAAQRVQEAWQSRAQEEEEKLVNLSAENQQLIN